MNPLEWMHLEVLDQMKAHPEGTCQACDRKRHRLQRDALLEQLLRCETYDCSPLERRRHLEKLSTSELQTHWEQVIGEPAENSGI